MGLTDALKSVVGGVVPMLANAIVPGSGGFAKSILGSVFGVDPEDEPALIDAVKNATPEQRIALQAAELEHKERLADISANLDIEHLKDRQDARKRDTQLQLNGHHNYRADIMLGMAFISLLVIVVLVWAKADTMPQHVFGLFNLAAGLILKMISDAFQFEFGSSRGSKEKDLK